MRYVKLDIHIEQERQDQVIADLNAIGFVGFQQMDHIVSCYMSEEKFSDDILAKVKDLLIDQYPGAEMGTREYIEDQNWNDEWEQTLTPQFVGKFFIRPSWSEIESPSDATLLIIDPKMAFGTGYHETTRLILRKIPSTIEKGDKVLDAGTGTGILAIAAAKMGASWVFGFDVDEWSYRNASENIDLNEVEDKVTLAKGDQTAIPEDHTFDVIIANINRSVILPMLSKMLDRLRNKGSLILSGLTTEDRDQVESASALTSRATLVEITQDGEWICMHYEKQT